MTVPELFATLGEPAFRALEAEAIAATLPGFDGVLAMGGGALQAAATREVVAAAGVPVVWLRAELPVLALRVGDGATRPLLRGDVAGPAGRAGRRAGAAVRGPRRPGGRRRRPDVRPSSPR